MVERITWGEFRKNGFLWLTNMILHVFGLALVYEFDETGKLCEVYPARVKFRGFSEKFNSSGYNQVTQYMVENASALLDETEERGE